MGWQFRSLGLLLIAGFLLPAFSQASETAEQPVFARFTGRERVDSSDLEATFRISGFLASGPGLDAKSATASLDARLFSASPPPPPPGFELRPTLPAGLIPTDVAIADFNSDGRLDFAVTSGWEDSLSISFGKGDGTFELPRVYLLKGRSPLSVEAVDLQGDGAYDLIVCYGDSKSVGVLRGNGDGTFQQEDTYTVYSLCIDTVTRDFNGDGILDILVVFWDPHSRALLPDTFNIANGLGLLPGKGGGKFGELQFQRDGDYYGAIQSGVADLNGNGRLDVVSASMHAGVAVFLNDGDGNFVKSAHLAASWGFNPVTGVQVMDLDRDGCSDAVITHYLGHVLPFFGRCDGTFRQGDLWSLAGHKVFHSTAADIDGDGIMDLVLVGTRASILRGDGRGGFLRARTMRAASDMISAGCGDFNNDGWMDLLTVHQTSHQVSYIENPGSGRFGLPGGVTAVDPNFGYSFGPTEPLFADLNRDGQVDLLFIEVGPADGPHRISVLLGRADHEFESAVYSHTHHEPFIGDFALADFRNSGQLDLIMIGQYGGWVPGSKYIAFAPGLGDGRFGPTTLIRPTHGGGGLLAIADFNLDGVLDVATADTTVDPHFSGQRITVFLGNGDGTFQDEFSWKIGDGGLSPTSFFARDFNQDGRPDLLVWTFSPGSPPEKSPLYLLLGKGDGTFHPERVLFEDFLPFAVLDLNGDNLPDLLATKHFSSDYPLATRPAFEVFLGKGDGSFQKSAVYSPFTGVTFIPFYYDGISNTYRLFKPRIGDFNGDGILDVLAYQYDPETYQRQFVQFLLGNGDGTFSPSNSVYSFESTALVADLDGDGFSDLIGIDSGAIDVIRGRPGPSFQFELINPRVEGTRGYGRIRLAFPSNSNKEFQLTSSSPGIRPPPRVTVPAGHSDAVFAYSIDPSHDWKNFFSITTVRAGESAVAYGWQKAPEVLYVPHIGDGLDGRVRLRTSFLLVNTGDDARIRLEFFDPAYKPLELALEGMGPASIFETALPRGASISLESSGAGALHTGYARATIFGRIDGTAVFTGIDAPSGLLLYEAGVPLTRPQFEASVLLDSTGFRDTGLALVNTAASGFDAELYQGDALAHLRLYDSNYGLVGEQTPGLFSGEYRARFISEFFEDSPQAREMTGTMTIASETPLALMTLRLNQDMGKPFPLSVPNLTTFPVAPSRPERLTNTNPFFPHFQYLAEFGDGEFANVRFQTTLLLANTGIDSFLTIFFFDGEGQPMDVTLEGLGTSSKFDLTLERGQSLHLRSPGQGPLKVGHARIEALPKVVGTAVFAGTDPRTGTLMYEAGIPLTRPMKEFTIFVDSLGNRDTGIAIANPRDASWSPMKPANVRLRLYNTRFELLGERTLELPAGRHIARYIRELFPKIAEAAEMQGVMTVASDEEIIAVTLRSNDDPLAEFPFDVPSLTAFPVIPGSADADE
jgi:hypothetical protein